MKMFGGLVPSFLGILDELSLVLLWYGHVLLELYMCAYICVQVRMVYMRLL